MYKCRLRLLIFFISNYQQRAWLCINLLCNTVTTWLFEMKSKQPAVIIEESNGASIFVFVTGATTEQFIN